MHETGKKREVVFGVMIRREGQIRRGFFMCMVWEQSRLDKVLDGRTKPNTTIFSKLQGCTNFKYIIIG